MYKEDETKEKPIRVAVIDRRGAVRYQVLEQHPVQGGSPVSGNATKGHIVFPFGGKEYISSIWKPVNPTLVTEEDENL